MPDKTGLRHYSWTQSPHRLTALCTLKHTSLQSISVNTKGRQRVKLEELILNEPKLELDVLDLRQSSPLLTQTLKLPSEWLLTFSGVQGKSFFQPTDQETRAHQHSAAILCPFGARHKKNPKTWTYWSRPRRRKSSCLVQDNIYSRRGSENWVSSVLKREDEGETFLLPTSTWSEVGQWSPSLLGGARQQDKKWKMQVGTSEIQIIY